MQRLTVYRPNAARLRALRAATGESARQVAEKTGLDLRTVIAYEDDEATVKFQYNQLRRLADHYGEAFDDLILPESTDHLKIVPAPAQASA